MKGPPSTEKERTRGRASRSTRTAMVAPSGRLSSEPGRPPRTSVAAPRPSVHEKRFCPWQPMAQAAPHRSWLRKSTPESATPTKVPRPLLLYVRSMRNVKVLTPNSALRAPTTTAARSSHLSSTNIDPDMSISSASARFAIRPSTITFFPCGPRCLIAYVPRCALMASFCGTPFLKTGSGAISDTSIDGDMRAGGLAALMLCGRSRDER
mmetsp:Transcript_37371/g.82231  ORF Transcript_37371/g.82231 Transcript_37371/m.82231 type:complete len:209 (-) Transcript_37371:18-644(-)